MCAVDIRQSELREDSALTKQITDGSTLKVSDVLISVDKELQPPLRMRITGTHEITVDSIVVPNPQTNMSKTIPPISNVIPLSFSGATVSIPATNNNNITQSTSGDVLLLNITDTHYLRVGISLNSLGQIVLTAGQSNASLASASAPIIPGNTYGIGHIIVQNISGNIQALTGSNIIQYSEGSAAGVTGDASVLETAIRDQLMISPYRLVTPNVFKLDTTSLVDGSSSGEYSMLTNTYDLDSAEIMLSKQLLDTEEFLDLGKDVASIDLTVFWNLNNIDDSATYEISRDGVNFQTVTMTRISDSSSVFYGSHVFTEETPSALLTQSSGAINQDINTTTAQQISQEFSLVNSSVIRKVSLDFVKVGSPSGNLYVVIQKDNAGSPGDIVSESMPIDVTALSTGTLEVDVGTAPIIAGDTYHIVIRSDQDYKNSYVNLVTAVNIVKDASYDGMMTYNGSTWSDSSTDGLKFVIKGRVLDLRLKITASQQSSLDGFACFYDIQTGIITGVYNKYSTSFNSVSDNFNEFELPFIPDADLINCFYLEAGKVYKYGAFNIAGRKIIFPANTFYNGGVSATVTLVFDQMYGRSFDSSDRNNALMTDNHLGSQDTGVDRSVNGRGILLRNSSGVLREISLDSDDNIVISTVP
jgi:hypothetical protein